MAAPHAYAEPSDVYRESAMGALAFVTRPRPIDSRAGDSFDHATGTFTLSGHGYGSDDRVRLALVAAGSLPGGATSALVWVLPIDAFTFRVSATQGGPPLTFVNAGSGWGVQVDPEPRLRRLARSCTAIIDECLTANDPPLTIDANTGRYPEIVIGVCARMVARRYLPTMMSENPGARAAFDTLKASAAFDGDTDPPAQAGSLLGDWKRGKPVNPRVGDQNSIPDNSAIADVARQPTAWRTGSL